MKKLLILLLGLLFFASLYAENVSQMSSGEKIDSIYVLQKKIYKDVKDQPLQEKNMGLSLIFSD